MTTPVLELSDVHVQFHARGEGLFSRGKLHALTGVNLSIDNGETVGIVGESGCGKSTLARVLVGLQAPTSGEVKFKGEDLSTISARKRRQTIGSAVGIIYQDPSTALNRRLTVRAILNDPLQVHHRGDKVQRNARVRELMSLVGLSDSVADMFPSQLSGGQRQRVAIGRALALEPEIVIADEPTSALDVSVRVQILSLLLDLKERLGLAMVFISHDIQTVKRVSDRVVTMYLGSIVEEMPCKAIPEGIRHPYTRALFSATPSILCPNDPIELVGPLPSPVHPPSGCPFRTRCWQVTEVCAERMPEVEPEIGSPQHLFRCFHPVAPEARVGLDFRASS